MFLALQVEEVTITAAAVYFLTLHGLCISVWLWIPLLLSPDIFMLGYLFRTRLGVIVYNIVHHRATGLLIVVLGLIFHQEIMITLAPCSSRILPSTGWRVAVQKKHSIGHRFQGIIAQPRSNLFS